MTVMRGMVLFIIELSIIEDNIQGERNSRQGALPCHCEECSDVAIQMISLKAFLMAGLPRFARNDAGCKVAFLPFLHHLTSERLIF